MAHQPIILADGQYPGVDFGHSARGIPHYCNAKGSRC